MPGVAVDGGTDARHHRTVERVNVDDAWQAVFDRGERETLASGGFEAAQVRGEVVRGAVHHAAKRLVPLDEVEGGFEPHGEHDVSEAAVDRDRTWARHVDDAVGGGAHLAPDPLRHVCGEHHGQSVESVGDPVTDRVRRMAADGRVNVPLASNFAARLENIADVHDPGRLPGLDDVDVYGDDARVVDTSGALHVDIYRERRFPVAARRASPNSVHGEAPELERHHWRITSSCSTAKTVGDVTGVRIASRQRSRIRRRVATSPAGPSEGSPHTCSILTPFTTRLPPACNASGGSALTIAVGMPRRSISLLIVAPQRLHDPQVATRITASTPASASADAISRPLRAQSARRWSLPVVQQ